MASSQQSAGTSWRASDLFLQAGLPTPVWNTRSGPRREATTTDLAIGAATHRVVAEVCQAAQHTTHDELGRLTNAAVQRLVTNRSLGRLDKTRMRVLGLALQYLTLLLPPPPAELIGVENRHGNRRTDLTWHHPDLGTWFDEVKTRRSPGEPLDEATWTQVGRYLDLGPTRYPGTFRGVRILTLGDAAACTFITAEGAIEPLPNTAFSRRAMLRRNDQAPVAAIDAPGFHAPTRRAS